MPSIKRLLEHFKIKKTEKKLKERNYIEPKLIEKNLKEPGEDINQPHRVARVGSWQYDVAKLQQALKHKQEEMNLMRKRFEALAQKSIDVFEIIAPDGTIKYMSEASEKVIGYKPEERIGKKIFEYYEGKELEKLVGMVEQVLNEADQEIQGEVIFKTKAGKEIFLEVRMQNLLAEPAVKGIAVYFRDISTRVEMEKKYHIWRPTIN